MNEIDRDELLHALDWQVCSQFKNMQTQGKMISCTPHSEPSSKLSFLCQRGFFSSNCWHGLVGSLQIDVCLTVDSDPQFFVAEVLGRYLLTKKLQPKAFSEGPLN